MGDQTTTNARVVSQEVPNKNQGSLLLALFNDDGTPRPVPNPAAAQADSTATDVAGLKTDFNALLAKLRTAGILKTS